MEKLEEALKEALARNSDEVVRWTKYKDEHETAIANLKDFGKRLVVDVMVPVGSKAFMPGQLYHTNEIFVSHFQGVFSKCSSHEAQKIARHRIDTAKKRLECLETEHIMYKNKLEKPHMDGVLPSGEEREIIEEYNEEEENLWRQKHKRSVRETKLKESKAMAEAQNEKSHQDVMKLLDDLSLMEELEDELDKLEVEDDETLSKILSGEIQLPARQKRISYNTENKDIVIGGDRVKNEHSDDERLDSNDRLQNSNVHTLDNADLTNNNRVSDTTQYESDEDTGSTSSTEDIPQQVLQIESEAKHLSIAEKIKYFKKKRKEIEIELQGIKVNSIGDIEEKMNKMEAREYLSDYIDLLQDEVETEVQAGPAKIAITKNTVNNTLEDIKRTKKNKRITFAKKTEVQFIDNNQAANMVTRSKIELDVDSDSALKLKTLSSVLNTPSTADSQTATTSSPPTIDKKKEILEKVQQSFEYVPENQSQEDFNLVDKILGCNESKFSTLHIGINHSSKYFKYPGYEESGAENEEIIGSPADIYKIFNEYFPVERQASSINRKIDSSHVTEGSPNKMQSEIPNSNFSLAKLSRHGNSMKSLQTSDDTQLRDSHVNSKDEVNIKSMQSVKSILKNKEKVKLEGRNVDSNQECDSKSKSVRVHQTERHEFKSVIGEVIEKKIEPELDKERTESGGTKAENKTEPDPLPNEKFSDVYAPKKRISRFKQMRANS